MDLQTQLAPGTSVKKICRSRYFVSKTKIRDKNSANSPEKGEFLQEPLNRVRINR